LLAHFRDRALLNARCTPFLAGYVMTCFKTVLKTRHYLWSS